MPPQGKYLWGPGGYIKANRPDIMVRARKKEGACSLT